MILKINKQALWVNIIIFDQSVTNSLTTLKHIAIVCNPRAGKGKSLRLCKQLEQKIRTQHFSFETFSDQWPSQFDGFTDVFIAGGDGTLNYFINKYPDITIPLSIFKGGSGNDFAWKLYGNISLEEQFEKALNGQAKRVDAGICNGRYFLNGVGVGFDGEVVKAMGKKRFISAGHIAYLWTVIKKILFYRERELLLNYNGIEYSKKYFMISIANGSRYGGGFMVAPNAVIDDGAFEMVMITCIHPLRRFYYLPRVEKGRHMMYPFVSVSPVKKITISSARPIAAHIDGELMEDANFNIGILPGKYLFWC
jgi:YegS/Rv2252/BmrU family lipid kinase